MVSIVFGGSPPRSWRIVLSSVIAAVATLFCSPLGSVWAEPASDEAHNKEPSLPPGAILRLGRTAQLQGSRIGAMAISPDGKLTATGGYTEGAAVKLREVGSRRLVRSFDHDSSGSFSLAFSPDGRLLAAGSGREKTVRVWDVATGERLHLLQTSGYRSPLSVSGTLVAFSRDGKEIIGAGPDRHVQVWDVATGRERLRFVACTQPNRSREYVVALDTNDELVAVGTGDAYVRVYNLTDGEQVAEIEAPDIQAVQFSPDGETLAWVRSLSNRNAAGGPTPVLWDVATREVRTELTQGDPPAPVYSRELAFSPDGQRLAVADIAGQVHVWDLASGNQQWMRPVGGGLVEFGAGGDLIVTAGDREGRICYWNGATGEEEHAENYLEQFEILAVGSRGDTTLTTATNRAQVELWDAQTALSLRLVPDADLEREGARFASLSHDGRWALFGSVPEMRLLDIPQIEVSQLDGVLDEALQAKFADGRLYRAGFSADGTRLVTLRTLRQPSDTPWLVQLWQLPERRLLHEWSDTYRSAPGIALSADGQRLAMLSDVTGTGLTVAYAQIFDTTTGRELQKFGGKAPRFSALQPAFSPDGRLLAIPFHRDEVHFFDVKSGERSFFLRGPVSGAGINRVIYSPDGRRVATLGSLRGTAGDINQLLQVWDVETGRVTLEHRHDFSDAAFVAGSDRLLVGLADRTALVLDLTIELPDAPSPTSEMLADAWFESGRDRPPYTQPDSRYDLLEILVAGGDRTIALVQPHLLAPVADQVRELNDLIDELASAEPNPRRAAVARLERLGETWKSIVAPARDAPLAPAECAKLKRLAIGVANQRRSLVAANVVSQIPTPAASELLQQLANNRRDSRLARIARDELEIRPKLRASLGRRLLAARLQSPPTS